MISVQRMCEGNGIGVTYGMIKKSNPRNEKSIPQKMKSIQKKQQNNLFNEMVYHL